MTFPYGRMRVLLTGQGQTIDTQLDALSALACAARYPNWVAVLSSAPLQGVTSIRSPSLPVKVSDFSPAVIKRGLGRGESQTMRFNAGRIETTMPCFQQSAHMSFSITVPPCLRPLRVNTPLSSVMLAREPQRLHCHIPSGFGWRLIRSTTACFPVGRLGGTIFSMF